MASGITALKKRLRPENGCWVVSSPEHCCVPWVRQIVLWLSTQCHENSAACYVDWEDAATDREKSYCWVCKFHLVQCHTLIFSVIPVLHIFFMFTRWFNMQHIWHHASMCSCQCGNILDLLDLQSVRKVWKFGRNLDICVPMAAAPAPVSQQGEEFDVSFSKPVDSWTTSPEAISEPADLSLRKSFACHKIKRILEWW